MEIGQKPYLQPANSFHMLLALSILYALAFLFSIYLLEHEINPELYCDHEPLVLKTTDGLTLSE